MLEVVAHDMRPPVADASGDRRRIRGGRAEPVGHRRQDEFLVSERRERHEDRPALGVIGEQTRQFDRKPRLPGPAGADDG